jgi:hypothetical protein
LEVVGSERERCISDKRWKTSGIDGWDRLGKSRGRPCNCRPKTCEFPAAVVGDCLGRVLVEENPDLIELLKSDRSGRPIPPRGRKLLLRPLGSPDRGTLEDRPLKDPRKFCWRFREDDEEPDREAAPKLPLRPSEEDERPNRELGVESCGLEAGLLRNRDEILDPDEPPEKRLAPPNRLRSGRDWAGTEAANTIIVNAAISIVTTLFPHRALRCCKLRIVPPPTTGLISVSD